MHCLQVLYHSPNLYNLCILRNQADKQPKLLAETDSQVKRFTAASPDFFLRSSRDSACTCTQVVDSFDFHMECTVSVSCRVKCAESSVCSPFGETSQVMVSNRKHVTCTNQETTKKSEKGILGHLVLTLRPLG